MTLAQETRTSVNAVATCRAVHQVHHVVEAIREEVNVLAIERGHEAPVNPLHHLIGELVGRMLLFLDASGELVSARRVSEELVQKTSRRREAGAEAVEQVEKAFVLRQETHGREVRRVREGTSEIAG